MMTLSINPNEIYVNQPTEVILRLNNNSKGTCTNVCLTFRLSREILLLGGNYRIPRIELIEAGRYYDYCLRLKATQEGEFYLFSTNFSFRDAVGRVLRPSMMNILIRVIAAPLITANHRQKEKPMPDPNITAWAMIVANKATELLFNQVGETLKEWREKRKKSEDSPMEHESKKLAIKDSGELKIILEKRINKLEQKSQITAYQVKLRESEALIRQIEKLHSNKLLYAEEEVDLPSLDDRVAIRRRIENIDKQIAEKANEIRNLLEYISQQKIYIPALDD